ncbi:MAG: LysM peptidoglycan-binding domain-containing protein [Actinomycetota bacterium]
MRTVRVLLVGLVGTSILSSCGGGDSEAGFTLPLLRTVPESTLAVGTTTTLPLFEELYTIQEGDTLSEIAQIFGVLVDDLISYNAIADPDAIQAGQVLKVPSPANPSGTTTSTTTPP